MPAGTTPIAARSVEAFAEGPSRAEIDAFLRRDGTVLITSHSRPDGDAVGSMLAVAGILDQLGIGVDLVLADPVPQVYATLPAVDRIRISPDIEPARYAGAIVLECDGLARTGLSGLETLPLFNLDHHITGAAFGTLNWIDWTACAVAALVYKLAQLMQVQVTPAMATCLYTAVFTDTGAFTYPGTALSSFALASELIALGADADAVARDVLYSVSAAHIRLLGIALSRMHIRETVAWSYITQNDLAAVDATDEDSEGTVTYLISIAGIHAAVFLRELPKEPDSEQRFRVSLRSKSTLDVSAIAATCGGGGHRNAAGCILTGDLHSNVTMLLRKVQDELSRPATDERPWPPDSTVPGMEIC